MNQSNNFIASACETVNKAGAWLTESAKRTLVVFGFALVLVAGFSSCEKNPANGNFDQETSAGALAATCETAESIPVDANGIITIPTLTNDRYWKLDGVAYVDEGQTLTIQPGTKIMTGATKTYNDPTYGTQNLAGVLVVARGGKLIADGGSPSTPIVFTTPKALGCTSGCSNAGEFGGIVILGRATTNTASAVRIEGVPQPAGTDITYGGPSNRLDSDNSGILRYVRIEFPGYRLDTDNEINGLTLGGVGSGTTLSHIQVSYSADDAFEFFGGTVDADHLVAIGTDDDDYDFDLGYTGTIEYAIGLKDPSTTNSTSGGNSDSNGIESDNNGSGSTASPRTEPKLRHFTLLGYNNTSTKLRNGNRWRRATDLDIQYSIVGGFPTGVLFESAPTIASASKFTNNVVHAFSSTAIFSGATPGGNTTGANTVTNDYLQLGFGDDLSFLTCANSGSFNVEDLIPSTSSPAYGSASTYKGALQPGVAPWTNGWTNFSPGFCCN
ncbi:hypothetical protein ACS126_03720 [Sphingobacterium lactis]|uniref:hypothetical protein n=1 Tax=Sphingobacterium TaxID=28453 RepID=UPI0021A668DF|nr:hypothetical protein [Sphingobacterium hotanense]MCT1525316.1 hypothetical protein [Sphingobacterium hotanense]